MKKICWFLTMTLAVLAFAACSGGTSSPKSLAETTYKAIQDQNYDKVVDLIGDKEGNALDEQTATQLKAILKEKAKEAHGLESYQILSEEVSDDGNEAVVIARVTYKGQEPKEDKLKMKKGSDGTWRLDMGK